MLTRAWVASLAFSRPSRLAHMAAVAHVAYDHLHFYVDELKPLAHYKAIEGRLNTFAVACADG